MTFFPCNHLKLFSKVLICTYLYVSGWEDSYPVSDLLHEFSQPINDHRSLWHRAPRSYAASQTGRRRTCVRRLQQAIRDETLATTSHDDSAWNRRSPEVHVWRLLARIQPKVEFNYTYKANTQIMKRRSRSRNALEDVVRNCFTTEPL